MEVKLRYGCTGCERLHVCVDSLAERKLRLAEKMAATLATSVHGKWHFIPASEIVVRQLPL